MLDADYFRRIDALNFTMVHDDGRLPSDLNQADIIILGISRTSKTPTSIYLAQRGYKTANVPLVPRIDLAPALLEPHTAFVVGLVASPDRISEIRRNRVQLLADRNLDDYVDRDADRERDRSLAPLMREAWLAGDRRDAALDRGDGGDDPATAARARAAPRTGRQADG